MRILYIDDQIGTEGLSSRTELMREAGIDVVEVQRVEDVLPALRTHKDRIDLIIVDMIMPYGSRYTSQETEGGVITGRKVVEDIRRVDSEVPIMFLSISRQRPSRKFMERHRVNAYIEKPILALELIELVRSYASDPRSI
jgi:CheY-like chemotaxis protein